MLCGIIATRFCHQIPIPGITKDTEVHSMDAGPI